MEEGIVDAWYCWGGVALASLAVFGVVLGLPTGAGPDAAAVAETVDGVASSDHEARATRPLRATAIRLGPHRIALRSDAGTDHASFAYGPVTPALTDPRLQQVLDGAAPERVFRSRRAFVAAVRDARTDTATWRAAPDRLTVRRVTWEGIDVTLVGP